MKITIRIKEDAVISPEPRPLLPILHLTLNPNLNPNSPSPHLTPNPTVAMFRAQ